MSLVAIVGRPNVGKSTLFNRILGKRKALVEDFPGVTRDRNYAEVTRFDAPFTLIDTGGFEPVSEDRMLTQMREQSQFAIEEADIIVFVMDCRSGLNPADEEVANLLRKVDKPVLYVVNKVESDREEVLATEFYSLGLETYYPLSAEHGRGIGDFYDALMDLLPEVVEEVEDETTTSVSVIGRPNVGKSSLVNRLLGSERVVANPESGTTRDSIDTPFNWNNKRYLLIDTAGIRRKGKVSQKLEKYSVIQALKAMDRSHIVLVVIDAVEGVTDQDMTVAGYAHEKGRALVLVVNKWDAVEKDQSSVSTFTKDLRYKFKFLPEVPILFVSALTGQRVAKIMGEVESVADEFNRKMSTSLVNQAIQDAVATNPAPYYQGHRIKFFYATQTRVRPPSFRVFVSKAEGLHFSYKRFINNQLSEALNLKRVPLRIEYTDRKRKF